MKLELKHIAPYLPYKLKILHFDKPKVLNAGQGSSNHWIGINATVYGQHKLILRPLSDLTKEIEINGEKFVPYKKLEWGNGTHVIPIIERGKTNYSEMEKLIEWHFDVFGLIEKRLAIDINTL